MQGGFASLFGARHRRVSFEGLMQGGFASLFGARHRRVS